MGYGAQGIVYDNFCQYGNDSLNIFPTAPLDPDGNRMNLWYMIQKINREISAFNDVFKDAKVIDCRHTGDVRYQNTEAITSSDFPFGPLKSINTDGAGLQLSLLEKTELVKSSEDSEGYEEVTSKYLLIVNHDIENYQTIKPSFTGNYQEVKLSVKDLRYSWPWGPVNTGTPLPPGGYKIYKYW